MDVPRHIIADSSDAVATEKPLHEPESKSNRPLRGRLTQLDGLRFFAIAAVFLHHSLAIPMLWIGVDLFFVLSGYLITAILLGMKSRPGYFRVFYYRRFLRIFPSYYLFLIICFLVVPEASHRLIPWYVTYFNNINDAFQFQYAPISLVRMWSLAIEEQFYLLWPLVVLLTPRRNLPALCLGLICLAPVFRVVVSQVTESYRPGYFLLPSRVDLLALGALLTLLEQQGSWLMRRGLRFWSIFGVSCLIAFVGISLIEPSFRAGENSPLFNSVGYSLIAGAMASTIAVSVQLPPGFLLSILQWRPFAYLGMISYTMYLYHTLAIEWARSLVVHPAASAILAWGITVGIGELSWRMLERPLQKLKDGVLPR